MSLFSKIKNALFKTSNKISVGISSIFSTKKLDENTIEELEELLLSSDMSFETTSKIISEFKKKKFDNDVAILDVQKALSDTLEHMILENQTEFMLDLNRLNIFLLCGVNGNGKTTTIAKLAAFFKAQEKRVVIAACDTFRAAAVDQLYAWSTRLNVPIVIGAENSDPASVVYKAVEDCLKNKADVLLVDTAGRLHNKPNLMNELSKMNRVVEKAAGYFAQNIWLVLDSTTGQNALNQVEEFKKFANINGLIVTKLDGTAKGGMIVTLSEKFKLPIYFLGVGESVKDLQIFDAKAFADALVGL
jgi:fused signal recognition particle receptor